MIQKFFFALLLSFALIVQAKPATSNASALKDLENSALENLKETQDLVKELEVLLGKAEPDEGDIKDLVKDIKDRSKTAADISKTANQLDPKSASTKKTLDYTKKTNLLAKKAIKDVESFLFDFDAECKNILNLITAARLEDAQNRLDKLKKHVHTDEQAKKAFRLQKMLDEAREQ